MVGVQINKVSTLIIDPMKQMGFGHFRKMNRHLKVFSVTVPQGLLEITARGRLGAKAPFRGVLGPRPTPLTRKSINPPLELCHLKRRETDQKKMGVQRKRGEKWGERGGESGGKKNKITCITLPAARGLEQNEASGVWGGDCLRPSKRQRRGKHPGGGAGARERRVHRSGVPRLLLFNHFRRC